MSAGYLIGFLQEIEGELTRFSDDFGSGYMGRDEATSRVDHIARKMTAEIERQKLNRSAQ